MRGATKNRIGRDIKRDKVNTNGLENIIFDSLLLPPPPPPPPLLCNSDSISNQEGKKKKIRNRNEEGLGFLCFFFTLYCNCQMLLYDM